MTFILSTLCVAWALASAFMQASDNQLKNRVSPGLTALAGLLLLTGALAGNVQSGQGVPLAIALLILAGSDFAFERSAGRPEIFPLAMLLGVVSGLISGSPSTWSPMRPACRYGFTSPAFSSASRPLAPSISTSRSIPTIRSRSSSTWPRQ